MPVFLPAHTCYIYQHLDSDHTLAAFSIVSITALDHAGCWLNICTGRTGDWVQWGRPLYVPFLVCPGPRHTWRHHHHVRGVWRALCSRLVHLCGGHHHLPQPDLVGVVVHGEHRCATQGAGGRCGNDEAKGPRTEADGEERVGAPLQQVQGLFQEDRPDCRGDLHGPQQPKQKHKCWGDAFHFDALT